MKRFIFPVLVCLGFRHAGAAPADLAAANLPSDAQVTWDLTSAYRETKPSRERICVNGLWRWQPADTQLSQPPSTNWGYFKVPGCWPGITDYMQKDSQTLYAHPSWAKTRLSSVTAAWYERSISVPAEWVGRRIALTAD